MACHLGGDGCGDVVDVRLKRVRALPDECAAGDRAEVPPAGEGSGRGAHRTIQYIDIGQRGAADRVCSVGGVGHRNRVGHRDALAADDGDGMTPLRGNTLGSVCSHSV
jgi:hypothetical protein